MKIPSYVSLVLLLAMISVSSLDVASAASTTMRRGPSLYNQNKKMSERVMRTRDVKNEVQSAEDREIKTLGTLPGLLPWESLTYKNRVRRAFRQMDLSELPYMKPETEANKGRIHYTRPNRSARGTLDGEVSGKKKLLRYYFQ